MTAMNNNRRVPTDGGALPNDVSIVFSNDDAGCTCGNPNAGRSNQEKELKKETDNFLMVSIHFHGCTFKTCTLLAFMTIYSSRCARQLGASHLPRTLKSCTTCSLEALDHRGSFMSACAYPDLFPHNPSF